MHDRRITVVLLSFLYAENQYREARVVDLVARLTFPLVLMALLGWFFLG